MEGSFTAAGPLSRAGRGSAARATPPRPTARNCRTVAPQRKCAARCPARRGRAPRAARALTAPACTRPRRTSSRRGPARRSRRPRRVSQSGHVEGDGGRVPGRGLGDHQPPALDERGVQQQPGRAQQPVLLGLGDMAGERRRRARRALPAGPAPGPSPTMTSRPPVTGRTRSHSRSSSSIALVLDEAPHGEEQRLGRARGERARLLDTVVDEPDPLARRHRGRASASAVEGETATSRLPRWARVSAQCSSLLPSRAAGPGKRIGPHVGVHMVDQAERRSAVPQRGEVRHAVAHLDEQVAVADLPCEGAAGAQEVPGVAAGRDDAVVAVGGGAAAQQGDLVAVSGEPVGDAGRRAVRSRRRPGCRGRGGRGRRSGAGCGGRAGRRVVLRGLRPGAWGSGARKQWGVRAGAFELQLASGCGTVGGCRCVRERSGAGWGGVVVSARCSMPLLTGGDKFGLLWS